ncbi:dihydrofolate reductase family protein [Pseudonocardia abyssalis]|uniref:Dihydrofolate reductase family protein n=1 Tax=Pseudonocardia abyssalis TaxID=2792008 RepID=A0ABS6V033_9PSEU|nr:dihydrofolate reductase family protein [Pseudonocardia abyssalis]MBW0118223.1 dihydrofolate reductase family protein [Pseudonocardia abyssalis]MBW0137851.1 dihydrofolate reductase family protein [Pseudonocardia abyssalis]
MATTLYSATMSLDGFIAGPDGDMSWLTEHLTGGNPTAERLLAGVGAILAGRTTYGGDDPNRGTEKEGAFGGAYHGPVVVLTHRPPADPPPDVVFCTDLHDAVARACGAAGEGYVNVLGADVARQCVAAGLLDEVLVFVAPVLLGDGVRLFHHPGGAQVRLERLPGETEHWYRVLRRGGADAA